VNFDIECVSDFLVIFGCSAHFKSELRQNGWRWPCKQELIAIGSRASHEH